MKPDPAFELAAIRREVLTYLEPLPGIIKAHGADSLGTVALALGKCLLWTGPTLDRYTLVQPLPGTSLPTVTALGEQLRLIGLDTMHNGDGARRTIETLKQQIKLLQKLAEREAR